MYEERDLSDLHTSRQLPLSSLGAGSRRGNSKVNEQSHERWVSEQSELEAFACATNDESLLSDKSLLSG